MPNPIAAASTSAAASRTLANASASGSGRPSIWRRPNVASPNTNVAAAAATFALIQSAPRSYGDWASAALVGTDTVALAFGLATATSSADHHWPTVSSP